MTNKAKFVSAKYILSICLVFLLMLVVLGLPVFTKSYEMTAYFIWIAVLTTFFSFVVLLIVFGMFKVSRAYLEFVFLISSLCGLNLLGLYSSGGLVTVNVVKHWLGLSVFENRFLSAYHIILLLYLTMLRLVNGYKRNVG